MIKNLLLMSPFVVTYLTISVIALVKMIKTPKMPDDWVVDVCAINVFLLFAAFLLMFLWGLPGFIFN